MANTLQWWVLSLVMLVYSCHLSLMHWPASWLTVWSPDYLCNWPVSRQIELTTWAMTTGWLTDGLIVCPTVCWTLHLASGHGYNLLNQIMAAKHFNTDMQTFNAWLTEFRVRRSNKQLIDKLILRSLISVLFPLPLTVSKSQKHCH